MHLQFNEEFLTHTGEEAMKYFSYKKYKCMCKPKASTHDTYATGREVREGEREERLKEECEEKRGADLW